MLNVTKNIMISRGSLKINKKKVDYNAAAIPDIKMWFDASTGAVTSTGTQVLPGDRVFGWKNRLTDIVRANSSVPAEQPVLTTTSAGLPSLRFSGAQYFLNAGGGLALAGSTDYTIVAVVTRTRASGGYFDYIFSTNNGNSATFNGVINNLSANFQPGANRSNGTTVSYKNGSSTDLAISNNETCVVAISTSGGAPSNSGSPYQIGFGYVGGTNYFLTGDIAELILIARAVPQAEITQITNGLKLKYEL